MWAEGEEPEPEFIGQIANVTVAQGRDAVLSCSVAHLNDYVVRDDIYIRIVMGQKSKRILPGLLGSVLTQ